MSVLTKEEAEKLSRRLVDSGKLVEAGFVGLRLCLPPGTPDLQVEEMRNAFFAGAQHLFASIMTILEPGAEPTEKDLRRMTLIDAELREFIEGYKKKHGVGVPKGRTS